MPRIRIDHQEIEVEPGATILQAARQVGISIPTLCHREGSAATTSCLVCVVKVDGAERLRPSCATRVHDGMIVESDTEEVRAARRMALELLLGDHLGDCVAPCQMTCPAHMDIPAMIRHIASGRLREAIATVKEQIALPAVLGRICPELCERGCRRGFHDAAVAIRLLKRFAADVDLASEDPYVPQCKPASGKRVAIVGAGPAGLAGAYYLLREGHACVLYDEHDQPGGMLRYGVPPEHLPPEVLTAEVEGVRRMGAEFRLGRRVGADIAAEDLRQESDAVLIAAGELGEEDADLLGLPWAKDRLEADRDTQMTTLPGVFLAGSALKPSRHAVRAVASGRSAALAITQHMAGEQISVQRRPWTVRMGRLDEEEMARFAQGASRAGRISPGGGEETGFTTEEARREAERCLHCDCRGLKDCKLRQYAIEYGASASVYADGRRRFEQDNAHPDVIYEPGKCIDCGLCIELASKLGEPLGLTFIGRGFDVRVGVPFDETVAEALRHAARECADACPTGALALRDGGGSGQ